MLCDECLLIIWACSYFQTELDKFHHINDTIIQQSVSMFDATFDLEQGMCARQINVVSTLRMLWACFVCDHDKLTLKP